MKKTGFQVIPGVGKNMEQHFYALGYNKVSDLIGEDPEEMFRREEELHGKTDLCVLYVYRLAVYFASNQKHDPEKLKWWYWKEKKVEEGK